MPEMKEFEVILVRSIYRTVKVTATSAAAVYREITKYGEIEAFTDYPLVQDGLDIVRIRNVEPV